MLCYRKRSATFDPVTKPEWSARLVAVVAGEVRRHRRARGLSVRELAEAVEEIGLPIQAPVLSNLELGRRPTISVAEWLALSAALRVPPDLLLFPVGRVETVEPLPGVEVSPLSALHWAETGRLGAAFADVVEPASDDVAHLIERYRRHQELVGAWGMANGRAMYVRHKQEGDEAAGELTVIEQEQRFRVGALWDLRDAMRSRGLTPPELPEQLSYLDGEDAL